MSTPSKLVFPALIGLLALVAPACGGVVRSVTHISNWSGPSGDYFYVAYAENETVSRIKLCHIHDDNTVTCDDQPEVDRLLNQ